MELGRIDGWLSVILDQGNVNIFYKIKFGSVIPYQWFNFFKLLGNKEKTPLQKNIVKLKNWQEII